MKIEVKKGRYCFSITGNPIPKALLDVVQDMFGLESVSKQDEADSFDWNEHGVASEPTVRYGVEEKNFPGEALRIARKNARMTQKELAAKLGTSCQYISNMENGSKPIGWQMASRLGSIFSMEPSVFIA